MQCVNISLVNRIILILKPEDLQSKFVKAPGSYVEDFMIPLILQEFLV